MDADLVPDAKFRLGNRSASAAIAERNPAVCRRLRSSRALGLPVSREPTIVGVLEQRFAEEGIEGLLRDKTRPPGIPPVPQAKVHALVERTLREPPGAVTHWTGRAMAKGWVFRANDPAHMGRP